MKIDAKLKKRLMTAGSVFAIALGTGFVMQKVGPMAEHLSGGSGEAAAAGPVTTAPEIQPLSAALHQRPTVSTASGPVPSAVTEMERAEAPTLPSTEMDVGVTRSASLLPVPALQARSEPRPATVQTVALTTEAAPAEARVPAAMTPAATAPAASAAADPEAAAQDCALKLKAQPAAAAMVRLTLSAPCNPGEAVTVKHGPLAFTDMTDETGALTVEVPALAAKAAFQASLASGARAMAVTLVDGLDSYERTALNWAGPAGVTLQAFENGAAYGTEGHIDASAPAGPSRALEGEGGFMTVLGTAEVPGVMMAEVYSYPTAIGGTVRIDVEAEVTEANCGREASATVLTRSAKGFTPQALSVTMPACDAIGEYLVFSNIRPELRLAAAE